MTRTRTTATARTTARGRNSQPRWDEQCATLPSERHRGCRLLVVGSPRWSARGECLSASRAPPAGVAQVHPSTGGGIRGRGARRPRRGRGDQPPVSRGMPNPDQQRPKFFRRNATWRPSLRSGADREPDQGRVHRRRDPEPRALRDNPPVEGLGLQRLPARQRAPGRASDPVPAVDRHRADRADPGSTPPDPRTGPRRPARPRSLRPARPGSGLGRADRTARTRSRRGCGATSPGSTAATSGSASARNPAATRRSTSHGPTVGSRRPGTPPGPARRRARSGREPAARPKTTPPSGASDVRGEPGPRSVRARSGSSRPGPRVEVGDRSGGVVAHRRQEDQVRRRWDAASASDGHGTRIDGFRSGNRRSTPSGADAPRTRFSPRATRTTATPASWSNAPVAAPIAPAPSTTTRDGDVPRAAGQHRAAGPVPRPLRTPLRERLAPRLLVVRVAQHVEQFAHRSGSPCRRAIDRLLGELVAQHVARVHRVHPHAARRPIRIVGGARRPSAGASRDPLGVGRSRRGRRTPPRSRQPASASAQPRPPARAPGRKRVMSVSASRSKTSSSVTQRRVVSAPPGAAPASPPGLGQRRVDAALYRSSTALQRRDAVEQRAAARCASRREVPVCHRRLLAEAVAAALGVGDVRRPVRIERLEPAVRAVVDGQAEDRHVVGVHHAVHEARRASTRRPATRCARMTSSNIRRTLRRRPARAPGSSGEREVDERAAAASCRRATRGSRSCRSAGTTARRGTRPRPARAPGGRRRACRAPPARRWRRATARAWSARRGGASPRCTGTRAATSAAPRGRRRAASTASVRRP